MTEKRAMAAAMSVRAMVLVKRAATAETMVMVLAMAIDVVCW
jgi:hypothetical protein